MALDWSNERYVRLYRVTPDHAALCWQARVIWPLMIQAADGAGIILTAKGARGVAAAISVPVDVVEVGLADLLDDGCVVATPDGFALANYVEAQTAISSTNRRQAHFRDRERAAAAAENATSRKVTPGNAASREVTPGNAASRSVTPSRAEPSRAEDTDVSGKPDAPPLELFTAESTDGGARLAKTCCDALAEFAGRKYQPGSVATAELARKLAKKRATSDQVRTVVEHLSAKWRGDVKMDEFLRPSTILSPGKFFAYLDDANAGSSVAAPWRMPEV